MASGLVRRGSGLWAAAAAFVVCLVACGATLGQDWRDIRNGLEVPSLGYADQPFVVTLNDGSWLCVLTTGPGDEGATGQHVVATRSDDLGETWSELVAIEGASETRGRESSWAVPLHVGHQGSAEFGRVYVFYVYNGEPMLEVPERAADARLDTLGWYMYRYSDDGGATWSARRRIRIPVTRVDRRNTFGGEVQMFWGTSEPVVVGGRVLIAISKIRRHLVNDTEGWVLACDNLLDEPDMSLHEWRLLGNGQEGSPRTWRGLKSEERFGGVQSEHTPARMDEAGHLYMVNRTDAGVLSCSVSRDAGETWSEPEAAVYANGRPVRHPRANAKVWRVGESRYLLWQHNHGGTTYQHRNPAWLSGGIERGGTIVWGEPEIVLYDTDPATRMSYPDLVMQDGRYWIFETQKSVARLHEIDPGLIDGLWSQFGEAERTEDAVVCAGSAGEIGLFAAYDLSRGEGFSVELAFDAADLVAGSVMASARDENGGGWSVRAGEGGRLEIEITDGVRTFAWTSDPLVAAEDDDHRVVVIVDGASRIVCVVAGGRLQDGGGLRQFGWGRLPGGIERIGGSGVVEASVRIAVHGRALTTAEAVGNCRSGAMAGLSGVTGGTR